ncbi:MAG: hypothetical protein ACPF9D_03705 [Owenweeksia sp.]
MLTTGVLLLAALALSLIFLRKEGFKGLERSETKGGYQTVSTQKFNVLKVGANWNVYIRQSTGHRTQLGEDFLHLKDHLQWTGDTLKLNPLSQPLDSSIYPIRLLNIHFEKIEIGSGGHVYMENFLSDYIEMALQDSSSFLAQDVKFTQSSIKTNGNASITFIDRSGD